MASKSTAAKTADSAESLYTVQELAACSAQVFGTSPDIVTAALKVAGVKKTTQREASRIVEAFRKKEV